MTTPYGALFNIAKAQPLDNNGAPQAACYLNFYITGTTTPQTVYSNATLATPLSQPVTADSSGRFVPIYLDPSKVYRYQLYNAAASLLQDVDPYLPGIANTVNTGGSFLAGSTTAPALTVNAPMSGRAIIEGVDNAAGNWFVGANNAANDLVTGSGARDLILQTPNNIVLAPTAAGTLKMMGPTLGSLVDMTGDSGTFTATFTGFSSGTVTATCTWSRKGNQATLNIPAFTNANSNATTMTFTGLPSAIQPATLTQWLNFFVEDSGTIGAGGIEITAASGTVTFGKGSTASAGGFTASGTKGTGVSQTITYLLT